MVQPHCRHTKARWITLAQVTFKMPQIMYHAYNWQVIIML